MPFDSRHSKYSKEKANEKTECENFWGNYKKNSRRRLLLSKDRKLNLATDSPWTTSPDLGPYTDLALNYLPRYRCYFLSELYSYHFQIDMNLKRALIADWFLCPLKSLFTLGVLRWRSKYLCSIATAFFYTRFTPCQVHSTTRTDKVTGSVGERV